VATATYNGDIYMIPDEGDMHGGWWRQDLFANAGYGTFDYKTFEYTGTTPNQMNYQELTQAIAKITSQGAANSVYSTFIPNGTSAFLGPWYTDNFLKANGALRYYGDSSSCTICLDQSPYYNQALDTLSFLQSNFSNMVPGFPTLDVNALITYIISGSLGFLFGPDPNLDGEMVGTAASKSNPAAPAGVNVRNCIQPTTGWSNGIPLNPALPPTIKFVDWLGAFRGSTNLKADWEWIRAMAGFNSQLSLVANAAGVPERLDVAAIVASDPRVDIAPWVAALKGRTYTDVPISSSYGSILSTAYANTFDAFYGGSGTPEQCISNFVQATTTGLQKAGIPAAPSSLII
jgi:ABC-type glycerol-3-phosphate transport system substrate-binding protein